MKISLLSRISPDHRSSLHWLYGAILLVVALAIYSGGLDNEFLVNWDDHDYVTENPDIQSVTLANIQRVFTTFYSYHYAPLQMLSYMVDFAVWGENPTAFILVNVLLHGLNAFIFFRLLCRLHLASRWALFAALLFVVHPVQVESVVWISERKNVLSMTFFLAAFWHYLSYTQGEGEKLWRHYGLALLWFVLALLTKSIVVVLPAILLAYDLILREKRESLRFLVLEKIPFALLAAGVAGLAIYSQRGSGDLGGLSAGYLGGSIYVTILTMLTVFKEYIFNLFWPLQLSAIYHVDIKSAIDSEVAGSALLMALSLSIFLFFRGTERRSVAFWTATFLIGFIPVSQIVPFITLMNDRYLYFPLLGFAGALAVMIQTLAERLPRLEKPVVFILSAILLLCSVLSWQRAEVWANSITLWQDAVQKQPESPYAWRNLGNAYDHYQRHQEAILPYQKAVQLAPGDYETYYNLGTNFLILQQWTQAAEAFRAALDLKPDYSAAIQNLGLAYTYAGEHDSAIMTFNRGLAVDPANVGLQLLSGANYYCRNDLIAARRVYEAILHRRERDEVTALATGFLALIAQREGDPVKSRQLLDEARLQGFSAAAVYFEWSRLEALARRHDQAIASVEMAITAGFSDRSAWADDPAFDSLRDDARFTSLLSR